MHLQHLYFERSNHLSTLLASCSRSNGLNFLITCLGTPSHSGKNSIPIDVVDHQL